MFVVTGASGQLGHAIVTHLARLGIVATCRATGKVPDLKTLGAAVRCADFSAPASLLAAFKGANQALPVSSNARAHGGDPFATP